MAKVISIIIPAYNVEKYIGDCLDSVINQTYKDLDIVVIDDGSSDSTPQIVDMYAARDKRVVAIHKPNGGLGGARNAGLKRASGDYVLFLDSDDWLEPECCEIALDRIEARNAELLFFEYYKEYKNKSVCMKTYDSSELMVDRKGQSEFFLYDMRTVTAWGKLYRADILKGKFYNENLGMAEDVDYNYKIYDAVNKAVYIDNPLLHYRVLEKSAVHGFDAKLKDKFDPVIECLTTWASDGTTDHVEALYSLKAVAFNLISQNGIVSNNELNYIQMLHRETELRMDPHYADMFNHIGHIRIPASRKMMIIFAKYNLWFPFLMIIKIKKWKENHN